MTVSRSTATQHGVRRLITVFQAPEILYTLAEISISVVGFTGVVVAVRYRNTDWSDAQKVRFSALIGPSLTALVACFFPEFISYFTLDADSIWRISNLALGLLHLSNIVPFYVVTFRSRSNSATSSQHIGGIIGLLTIAAHFLAAGGITPFFQAVFVFGVMQQIGVGILNFVLSLKHTEDT